jgi:SAM-dependent methyltransferase
VTAEDARRALEVTIAKYPGVRECALVAREGAVLAFVALDEEPFALDGRSATKQKLWENIFDEAYAKEPVTRDPTLDSAGYVDSFTGAPISADAMGGLVASTVERILEPAPRRILEIGCGTGMLLQRLAPRCERYVAVDASSRAIERLRTRVGSPGATSNVRLEACSALDIASLGEEVDAVVVNCALQYFPNAAYLFETLRQAARVVSPGGTIFLGEIRSLPLLPAFRASIELARARDEDTAAEIRKRLRRALAHEQELLLDPAPAIAMLRDVPRLTEASLALKRGLARSELVDPRFDLRLTVDGPPSAAHDETEWLDGSAGAFDAASLARLVEREDFTTLAVTNLRNARLDGPRHALAWIETASDDATGAELRAHVRDAERALHGLEPEALFALGAEAPRPRVELGWSDGSASGDMALRLTKDGLAEGSAPPRARLRGIARPPAKAALLPAASFCNARTKDTRWTTLTAAVERASRDALGGAPVQCVQLACFPRDGEGRVDRAALEELA